MPGDVRLAANYFATTFIFAQVSIPSKEWTVRSLIHDPE